MIWNYYGDIFIKIVQEDMATALMVNNKTASPKSLNYLPP